MCTVSIYADTTFYTSFYNYSLRLLNNVTIDFRNGFNRIAYTNGFIQLLDAMNKNNKSRSTCRIVQSSTSTFMNCKRQIITEAGRYVNINKNKAVNNARVIFFSVCTRCKSNLSISADEDINFFLSVLLCDFKNFNILTYVITKVMKATKIPAFTYTIKKRNRVVVRYEKGTVKAKTQMPTDMRKHLPQLKYARYCIGYVIAMCLSTVNAIRFRILAVIDMKKEPRNTYQ